MAFDSCYSFGLIVGLCSYNKCQKCVGFSYNVFVGYQSPLVSFLSITFNYCVLHMLAATEKALTELLYFVFPSA